MGCFKEIFKGGSRMIKFEKLSFSYGEKKIFENLDFEVRDGERVCLFGESGSGKTTLLRLIAGLEKAENGQIAVKGTVSAVFQEDRLLEWLTPRENVNLAAQDKEETDEIFSRLGILEVADNPLSTLSGGMKRRVAIARAVAFGGDILLLDEVFNGIDLENRKRVAEFLLEKYAGKTIVAVSHIKEDAELLKADIFNI